jgi:hypothetical protein
MQTELYTQHFSPQHLIDGDTARKPNFQTHRPSLIFDRSTFAFSIRFQSVYSLLKWSINRSNSSKNRFSDSSLIAYFNSIHHASSIPNFRLIQLRLADTVPKRILPSESVHKYIIYIYIYRLFMAAKCYKLAEKAPSQRLYMIFHLYRPLCHWLTMVKRSKGEVII